ncbi:MAG: GntR family transcriptional regulator [Betaproteobacteria bacterium]|nr:GntR family transcriptional regulator [Betaproteobacteria bacterium]
MPTPRRINGTRTIRAGAPEKRGDRIRVDLERAILNGRFAPGTKLDEEAIARRHGASRTPVREALQHLASRGLIELRPNAGAFVAELTVAELAESFETMAFLEAACAAMAARRHTAEDRRTLRAAHEACARAARAANPAAFYAANTRFHECLYAASHNSHLASQTVDLRNRLEAYRRESTFHPGFMALTMREHARILRAVLDMDEGAAASLMRSHLDSLRDDAVSIAKAMTRASARR